MPPPGGKWPKLLPALTADQQRISDDFMQRWHEELAGRGRYGLIEKFNHEFPVRHSDPGFKTTLEIGAGLGEHLRFEVLTPEQEANYYANDFRENMAAEIRRAHPRVQTVIGDCQQPFAFPDGYFDRIIAVHVLEHLPNLPDAALDVFFDEVLCAPTPLETVAGIYAVALPALAADLRHYLETTNPLVDAPSIRLLRRAVDDLDGMIAWGKQSLDALTARSPNESISAASAEFSTFLAAAGGMDGQAQRRSAAARRRSTQPFTYDHVPQRDERFPDPFNSGVNAEVMIHGDYPDKIKALMLLYKRLRETDVPEMMASILMQTPGKPWGYYRDMTRQLWDEARHALMGQVGFRQLGLDWSKIAIRHAWSYELNTILSPKERHGVLYFIEQGLMPKTGKRYEWEIAQRSENPLLATFQDFDWADEVLHARVGRDWYVKEFPNPTAAESIS